MQMDAATLIEVTPVAAGKLRELRGDDPQRAYLRLYVAGQSCCSTRYGMAFDAVTKPEDTVAEHTGIQFAIDPESRPSVEGATIDWVETPEGAGFTVKGVGGGSGCSCGRS
jgi:iron-sulfur cluster insertion protein